MNQYPYYIVQTREGRLPCPPQYKHTVIEKEFTSGRIGGRKLKEETSTDPQEVYALWLRSNRQATIYEVPARNRQRRRVRIDEIQRKMKGN